MGQLQNILVTGGAGFVGANLLRSLVERDYRVRVLDNFSTGSWSYLADLGVEVIKGNILDFDAVLRAARDVDGVVHLAAQTGVPNSVEDPRYDCEVNVLGTLNVLEACRVVQDDEGHQVRFVFASSNAPLGKQPPPATEDKAPLPIAPYGASKLAGEGYCLAYHGTWGLGTIVFRFANLYGPYSIHKESVVAKFLKDILKTGEITIHGDGKQTRDFTYVEDLAMAIILALESTVSGEVFQIATGVETSILELSALVQSVAGQRVEIQHGPPRQGDIKKNYSGIRKVERVLGWTPQTNLESGLRQTYHWFESVARQSDVSHGLALSQT